MNITKAIIPVAGWGTRRLPVTKVIEKCMIPVGNRPIIDYNVQDCLKAGIDEIIFVVSEQSAQIREYYRSNIPLNDYLKRNGKESYLPLVAPLDGVKLHFVIQPSYGKYGTAVPVALASEYINPGESVVVVMGDDFFYNEDESSEIARLIDAVPEGQNGILGAVLPDDDVITGRYGSIEEDEQGNLIRVTEHPENIPNPFVKNVAKYVLNYEMLMAVKDYVDSESVSGEYYIFTPFEKLIEQGQRMKVVHAKGRFLDGGSLEGWLEANRVVCGAR